MYIQETREKIREHIGRLVHGPRFLKDTLTAIGVTTVTAPKSARFGTDHFTGSVMYVIDGPVAGISAYVGANNPGLGQLVLSPVPAVMPSVGNKIEVWPEDTSPDDVNDAINLAILDVQHLAAQIAVQVSPTIDTARTRITIPSTWSMVARLTYEYGGIKYRLRPRDPRDVNPWDQDVPATFDIEGQTIVVWGGIPNSATNVRLVGYATAALPVNDTDPVTVRSDFVVYKAASILMQNRMATQLLDPEGSGSRATFWAQQAESKKRELNIQAISNTVRIEEAV